MTHFTRYNLNSRLGNFICWDLECTKYTRWVFDLDTFSTRRTQEIIFFSLSFFWFARLKRYSPLKIYPTNDFIQQMDFRRKTFRQSVLTIQKQNFSNIPWFSVLTNKCHKYARHSENLIDCNESNIIQWITFLGCKSIIHTSSWNEPFPSNTNLKRGNFLKIRNIGLFSSIEFCREYSRNGIFTYLVEWKDLTNLKIFKPSVKERTKFSSAIEVIWMNWLVYFRFIRENIHITFEVFLKFKSILLNI